MSGTTTIEVPKGPDKLDASDTALLEAMRADDDATPTSDASPHFADDSGGEDGGGVWVEIDDAGHADVVAADRAERRPHAPPAKATAESVQQAADMARLQERLAWATHIAQAAVAPPAAPTGEPPVPDVNFDPIGHFRAVAERQARKTADLEAILTGFQQRQQNNAQLHELRNWAGAQEAGFAAQQPAYAEAMNHLTASRHAELEAIGITDPADRQRIIGNDITNIAARARQEGANFAERLYKVAEGRGFRKGARATASAAPGTNAAQPGVRASNRSTPSTRLSVEKIAAMPEKQFAAVVDKLRADPAALRRLMGE